MVSEIIRWQTPLAYMRRIAKQDVELGGRTIKKGDRVVMWYASRDERKFTEINSSSTVHSNHLSASDANRLAELQLRILWEELLKRFENIEVVGEPEHVRLRAWLFGDDG